MSEQTIGEDDQARLESLPRQTPGDPLETRRYYEELDADEYPDTWGEIDIENHHINMASPALQRELFRPNGMAYNEWAEHMSYHFRFRDQEITEMQIRWVWWFFTHTRTRAGPGPGLGVARAVVASYRLPSIR